MKIKKGTLLIVRSRRKGTFEARALRDFDTEDEWYPVTPLTKIVGMANEWNVGDEVPCRKGISSIEIKQDMEKKCLEIPFGAQDEYTIPDGYEAEIKDGKVIVKKYESEDERIRKEIINYLDFAESHNLLRAADYEKKKGWLAYLEKQKEIDSTPLDWNDYKDKPVEVWNAYIRGKAVGIEIEKQKEQKPVEYLSEEKVFAIMKKLTSLSFGVPLGSDEEKQIHEITCDVRGLLDYPIKPVEWSEEDENIIHNICDYLLGVLRLSDTAKEKAIVFLNSLRPPKGWKEGWCEDCKVRYNHWKPTEEQMEALDKARRFIPYNCDILESLYEQLKML